MQALTSDAAGFLLGDANIRVRRISMPLTCHRLCYINSSYTSIFFSMEKLENLSEAFPWYAADNNPHELMCAYRDPTKSIAR